MTPALLGVPQNCELCVSEANEYNKITLFIYSFHTIFEHKSIFTSIFNLFYYVQTRRLKGAIHKKYKRT